MKSIMPRPLLATLLALCLVCSVAAGTTDVMSRAQRVLQGSKGPEIQQQCEDQGVNSAELDITEAKRKELRAEISGRFSGVFESFVSATASGKDLGSTAADNGTKLATGSNILFAGVIFVLSVLSFFWMFLWSITECCCKKTCCVAEQKKDEGRGKLRVCVWLSSVVVSVTTVVLVIVWAAYLKSSVNTFKETKCGIAILYNDLINGAKLEGGKTFMGITPLQKTLTDFKTSLESISDVKTQGQNIVNQDLRNKAEANLNKFKTYNSTVTLTDPVTTGAVLGAAAASVYLTALPEIVKQALSAENLALQNICNQIHDGCDTIAKLNDAEIKSITKTVGDLSTTIDTTVKANLENLYKSVTSGNGAESIQTVANTAFVISLVVVIVFTAIFLGVLFLTAYKDTCHWLKFFPKIIMILFILLAIFITIVCILFTVVVIVVYFVCYITDSLQTNQNSFKNNFSGLIKDAQMNDLANTCIFVGGDGDLLKALGFSGKTDTTKFTSMLDSATAIKSILSNLTSTDQPPVIGGIRTNFTQFSAFETLDRYIPPSESLDEGYKAFNDLKCGSSQETMQFKDSSCPTGATKSQTGDGANTGKGTNYCFVFPTYPTVFQTLQTRYSGSDCSDSLKANTLLTNVYKSKTSFQDKINTANTNANYVAARNSEIQLFADMKSVAGDMQLILTKLQSSADAVSSVGTTLNAAINCLILNKGIRVVENVVCYRMAGKIYIQSGVGAALGFFLFLYSWCICCSLRLANKKEESKDGTQNYNDNNPPAVGLQMVPDEQPQSSPEYPAYPAYNGGNQQYPQNNGYQGGPNEYK